MVNGSFVSWEKRIETMQINIKTAARKIRAAVFFYTDQWKWLAFKYRWTTILAAYPRAMAQVHFKWAPKV